MALQKISSFGLFAAEHKVGGYKSHGFGAHASSTNVQAAANAVDAFPFYVVDSSIVCDMMAVIVGTIAGSGTHNTICGVYSDANGYPGALLATTDIIDVSTTGMKEAPFLSGDLTLTRGVYWIARMSGGNTQFNGLSAWVSWPAGVGMKLADATIDQSGMPVGTSINGVRYSYGSWPGALPSTFPSIGSGAKWLSRTSYASPWIRRKA